MPGTYGSALGVALYFGLAALARESSYPKVFLLASLLAVAALSILVVAAALPNFTDEDPPAIVLDEVAGQMWALFPLSLLPPGTAFYWGAAAAGFLLFRALDAIKPYPVWKLERLRGGWGVVADDLAAGGLAAILLAGLIRWGG